MIKETKRRTMRGLAAAAVTAGLALTPAGTALAEDTDQVLGPDGYRDLELGMSEQEARATGLLTDREEYGDCVWYFLKPSEGEPNPGSGVVISPTEGVVNIHGTDRTATPEGITMGHWDDDNGSPTADIESGYERYAVDTSGPVPLYIAPAPGNADAQYVFGIGEDDKVKDLNLASTDTAECGLVDWPS